MAEKLFRIMIVGTGADTYKDAVVNAAAAAIRPSDTYKFNTLRAANWGVAEFAVSSMVRVPDALFVVFKGDGDSTEFQNFMSTLNTKYKIANQTIFVAVGAPINANYTALSSGDYPVIDVMRSASPATEIIYAANIYFNAAEIANELAAEFAARQQASTPPPPPPPPPAPETPATAPEANEQTGSGSGSTLTTDGKVTNPALEKKANDALKKPQEPETDYMPWILFGVVALAGLGVLLKRQSDKKPKFSPPGRFGREE